MKEEILAAFEKAKLELHTAIDAVAADAPEYLQAVEAVAEKHDVLQSFVKVLQVL